MTELLQQVLIRKCVIQALQYGLNICLLESGLQSLRQTSMQLLLEQQLGLLLQISGIAAVKEVDSILNARSVVRMKHHISSRSG
jgi:hypothetical protein